MLSDSLFTSFRPELAGTGSFSANYNGTGFFDNNNPALSGITIGEIITLSTTVTVPYGSFNLTVVENAFYNQTTQGISRVSWSNQDENNMGALVEEEDRIRTVSAIHAPRTNLGLS